MDRSLYDALMERARMEPEGPLPDAVLSAALYPKEAELAATGGLEFLVQTILAPCVAGLFAGELFWIPSFDEVGPARLELARHVLHAPQAFSRFMRELPEPELTPQAHVVFHKVVPTVGTWRRRPGLTAGPIVQAMWMGPVPPMLHQPTRSEGGMTVRASSDQLGISLELVDIEPGRATGFAGGSLYLPRTNQTWPIPGDGAPALYDEIGQLDVLN